MHLPSFALLSLAFATHPTASQQIWDIWQTTWDRAKLFTSLAPSTPINFVSPSVIGAADIVVDDTATFQSVWGFGGSLTDSSALILSNMKAKNSDNYWKLLTYMFSPTDGANAAGISYIRVPLGASDFSANLYSFDDTSDDTLFREFNIGRAPSYLYSVLKDIHSVNSILKVHVLPWSPPGWMKTTGSMNGGSLQTQYVSAYASYLLKCLQGFKSEGIPLYAISIQNEPQNSQSSYPTTSMSVAVYAQIGIALRGLMNSNGFSTVKLIGYEHNWDDAGAYPIQLMEAAPDAFDGVAFHCYAGTVSQQDTFHVAYPTKEIYFTECAGTIGSDWWSDIKVCQLLRLKHMSNTSCKWYMDNLFIGAITHNAHSALMWNIALDSGTPKLPGTTSCGGPGCRSIAQVNNDGSYSLNQEFYSMAQASKAVLPKDDGGLWGKRIGVAVGGELAWALVVGAYMTPRVNATDWLRYSLVVLNWDDNEGGTWDPQPVQTTIEFRDMQASALNQATYTFPVGVRAWFDNILENIKRFDKNPSEKALVGVTTLWWYAPPQSLKNTNGTQEPPEIHAETDEQQPFKAGVKFVRR
ncbi:glucan endo-1,6-beta-glucosidase [Mycena pura]|uniref:Glucan endo-1,6-beta-glucosidase n=1 Tax=Mycena pura TaxID=153505 RepID=A0AAD6YAN9_9AGAR|nr:glucan endo-1,6-beta-glucosidase [Mycena pura]